MRKGMSRRASRRFDWYEEYNPGRQRKWFKRTGVRLDRLEDRKIIKEQMDDFIFACDPD